MRPLRVAVVGKGGSGKSTVSGTMARLLARRGAPVLALDSDPMPGLSINLGLGSLDDAMLTDAAERDEDGSWKLKRGIGPARAVDRFAVLAPDGVHFLQFGKSTSRGLREILPSVNAFGHLAGKLARSQALKGWTVVGDLSAGTRQTAFNWAPYARDYLVVCEPAWASVLTARRLMTLAASREPDGIHLVANKVTTPEDTRWIEAGVGVAPIISLPADPNAARADREGVALLDLAPDSPLVAALEGLVDMLLEAGPDPTEGHG